MRRDIKPANAMLTGTIDKREPCADQAVGLVCRQTPAGGQLAKGRPVTVVVSTGAPKTEVPDVTDKDQSDAPRTLEEKGFEVRTRRIDSTRAPGTVLEQNPQAGEQAAKGTDITLTAAEAPERVTVSDLTGRTVSEARKLLTESNLKLGTTTEVTSTSPAGSVVDQSITAGETAAAGSPIDVQLATPRHRTTPNSTPTLPPPPTFPLP
ncbi:PASTA domain-containing protein [Streptomyces sp. GbtcB6]|uniref:PASTA domain-containing protein n=1 Tax=Streptomyces sp. GbtcB6 TaxID=2824751 RepID=UPI0027E56EF5|nr:PASTA domain-containing protein [Streptomyces sp. GbtcB6]